MKDLPHQSHPDLNPFSRETEETRRYKALFYKNFCPFAVYRIEGVSPAGDMAHRVRFKDVNPAYEEKMGVVREDVVGKLFEEVWPHTEPQWKELIERVVKTGHSVEYQGFNKENDRYFQALAFEVSPWEVAVLFFDITPRIRAQKTLERKELRLLRYKESLRNLTTKLTLAEEGTRRQIANDLHDSIGYSLATILHKLYQAEETLPEACFDQIRETIIMLESVIRETRDLTFAISSPLLYEVGLEAALESLGEQMLHPREIDYDFQEEGTPRKLPQEIEILLFQMTRELLVNVIKHAEATRVCLRILWETKGLRIAVSDNGKGFTGMVFRESKSNAFGLFSIRERLRHLRGYISINPAPPQGTEVALWAPYPWGEDKIPPLRGFSHEN